MFTDNLQAGLVLYYVEDDNIGHISFNTVSLMT